MLLYCLIDKSDVEPLVENGHTLVNLCKARDPNVLLVRCDGFVYRRRFINADNQRLLSKAQALAMPIYDLDAGDKVLPCKTELRYPNQCAAFIAIVMKLYRLHLQKNADYGSAAILGTGEIGLVTRLWDKVCRLLSLNGFNVSIHASSYINVTKPECDTIEDTLMDTAVYAIIGLLLRAKKWGS